MSLTLITGVIVPYMVDPGYGNLGPKVFFIWGGLCGCSIFWAYFFMPETRGLTLEQVDKMMEEVTARKSASWKPHENFGHATAFSRKSEVPPAAVAAVEQPGEKRV
jgi:SP family sugar:H+ symporter-like MFS transporter